MNTEKVRPEKPVFGFHSSRTLPAILCGSQMPGCCDRIETAIRTI